MSICMFLYDIVYKLRFCVHRNKRRPMAKVVCKNFANQQCPVTAHRYTIRQAALLGRGIWLPAHGPPTTLGQTLGCGWPGYEHHYVMRQFQFRKTDWWLRFKCVSLCSRISADGGMVLLLHQILFKSRRLLIVRALTLSLTLFVSLCTGTREFSSIRLDLICSNTTTTCKGTVDKMWNWLNDIDCTNLSAVC